MDPCLSRCKGRESLRTLVLKLSAPCPRNTIAMPEVVWQLLKLLWASASHSPKKEKNAPPHSLHLLYHEVIYIPTLCGKRKQGSKRFIEPHLFSKEYRCIAKQTKTKKF